jgi:hypothetical protein
MKKLLLFLLLPTLVLGQIPTPPPAINNWPTAQSAIALPSPTPESAGDWISGWDSTAHQWKWQHAGSASITLPQTWTMAPGANATTTALTVNNTTAAGNGSTLQQWSPTIQLEGNGYAIGGTPVSQLVQWRMYNLIQWDNVHPEGYFQLESNTNSLGWVPRLQIWDGWSSGTNVGAWMYVANGNFNVLELNSVSAPAGNPPSSRFWLYSNGGVLTVEDSAGAQHNIISPRVISATVDGGGSAIPVAKIAGYYTVPYSGNITGWSMSANSNSGTITAKVWRSNTGVPTNAQSLTSTGLQLTSSATHVRDSTPSGEFNTTVQSVGPLVVTAGDVYAVEVTAAGGATELTVQIEITP